MSVKKTADLDQLKSGVAFVWGQVRAIHEIGPYSIVEFNPHEYAACRSTGNIDLSNVCFQGYIDGDNTHQSYHSLDAALAGCIAYRAEGANHQADAYFMLALESIAASKS